MRIYFFSPTGACREAANALAGRFCGEVYDLAAMRCEIEYADPTLLIFPIYGQDVPKFVAARLKAASGAGRVIVLALYGGVAAGAALGTACRLVEKRGGLPAAAAAFACRHSYLSLPPAGIPFGEIADFVESALKKNAGKVKPCRRKNLFAYLPARLLSHAAVKLSYKPAVCARCGACARACPGGAIAGDLRVRPANCMRCLACAAVCPCGARGYRLRFRAVKSYLQKPRKLKEPRFL